MRFYATPCVPSAIGKLQSLCRHGQLMEGLRGVCQAIPHLCHSIGLLLYLCCTFLGHLEQ